jgi:hypothetical protein
MPKQIVHDDAIVIRGGTMSKDNFINGGTLDINNRLDDVSVQCSGTTPVKNVNAATIALWIGPIPVGPVGATTVKKIRQKGGNVILSPNVGGGGPNHCTLFGLTPKDAAEIFTQF